MSNATDRQLELIDATERYRSIHHSDVIERVFYLDFYALPQFGKSLLGFVAQKAKVGEAPSLPYIKEIAGLMQSYKGIVEQIVRVAKIPLLKNLKVEPLGLSLA